MTSDPVWMQRRNRWAMPALALAIVGLALGIFTQLGSFVIYRSEWFIFTQDMHEAVLVVQVVTGFISMVGGLCTLLALVLGTTAVVQVRLRPDEETGKGLGMAAVIIVLAGWVLHLILWGAAMVWQYSTFSRW